LDEIGRGKEKRRRRRRRYLNKDNRASIARATHASSLPFSSSTDHVGAAASSSTGGSTFGKPPTCATIDAKTGESEPYAGPSGSAEPPDYSIG